MLFRSRTRYDPAGCCPCDLALPVDVDAKADAVVERAKIAAAMRVWAEEGDCPWMSYCAERVARGEY